MAGPVKFEIDPRSQRDFNAAIRDFRDFATKSRSARTRATVPNILRNEMGLFTERLSQATPPFHGARGGAGDARRQGEGAVERDIRNVFFIGETLLQNITNEKLRTRIAKLIRAQDATALAAILKNFKGPSAGIQIANEPSVLFHQSQRNNRGRVYRNPQRLLILRKGPVNSYISAIKKHVGRAKAGWNAAAQKFGARNIPAWVKRHGAGDGSAMDALREDGTGYLEAVNTNKAITSLNQAVGIINFALRTRARDIRTKLEAAFNYEAAKFNRR